MTAKRPRSGSRFRKLEGQLARRGARDPGGLAATIGRRKYGPRGHRMKCPPTTATDLQARAETIRRHAPGIPDPTPPGETVRYRCDACCCCGTLWTGPTPLPTQWARCKHVINPDIPGYTALRCPGTLIPITVHRKEPTDDQHAHAHSCAHEAGEPISSLRHLWRFGGHDRLL